MKKGFTLIELLVVIAIIGILASIVLVSLNSAREKARDVKRVGDIRGIQLALEGYYDDNDAYPGGDGDGATCGALTAIATDLTSYITALPTDPGGGSNAYAYDAPAVADGQDYVLRADLEDADHRSLVDGADVYGCECDATGGSGDFCAKP